MAASAQAQTTFNESFTGTTASGWVFGANPGDTLPVLTANTVDSAGSGWLRLNTNATNQSTFALLDTQIFSVNAEIKIEMEYAFWNGTGADGITFFLVDGSVDSSTFAPGAYGGSMGYAQKTDEAGMAGGYLGFAFDNFGNYSNPTEGRVGGTGFTPNTIAVRGPDDGDGNNATGWDYIASSVDLSTLSGGNQMDFPTATTRPSQTGADYRSFRITIDANNQLLVEMKFGVSGAWITAFTADLSQFERPDTFKIGFTGATGSQTEIHEIRNLSVTTTPWSTGAGAYEWDNGAGTTTWGTTTGGTNTNWYSTVSGDDNKTPIADADVLFGNKPTNNGTNNTQQVRLGANVEVRNMTFDTGINYVIGETSSGAGNYTITMGDTSKAGLPSINVNNYNDAYARHKINANLNIVEDIAIRNYSYSTLCINGTIATNGNDITTSGYGATNLNGQITGSGNLIVNGSSIDSTGAGIVTISGANTTWSGDVTVNGGQLVVLSNNALGLTGDAFNRNTNLNAANGASSVRISNSGTIPVVGQEITGSSSIPAGTVVTSVTASGGNYIIGLSNTLTGSISSGTSLNYAYGNTTINNGGTLTFRGGVTTAEKLTINGTGAMLGRGEQGGAIYNDGGNNTLSGTIALGSDSSIRSRDGNLTLSGAISGGYSLTKIGDGVVTLSNSGNSYTGATIIKGGALRVTSETALPGGFATGSPSGGNLQLNGGVLEIGVGTTFARNLGTATDQVQFTGDGGFSAYGGNRTVTLSGGAALEWTTTTGFLGDGAALLLSSNYSDSTITLTNELRFYAAQREIRVADGSAAVDAELSGRIQSAAGGLVKTGDGTLLLSNSGSATNYGGATEIRGGALRISNTNAFSNNSNLQLNGGVLEIGTDLNGGTSGDYSQQLGTGGTQVRWTGSGGFSAASADRTVSLTNSSGTANGQLAWNTGNFVTTGSSLILGSRSSGNTLTLTNAIDLGTTVRDIRVVQGTSSTIANGVLSGVISGAGGGLSFTGNGRLDLTAANTYTGTTTIVGAEVRLGGANGALSASGGTVTVQQGGALTLDNSASNNANRLTAGVTLNGGTLNFLGATAASTETIGTVTLSGGANTINVQRNGTNSSVLTLGGFNITDSSATIDFTNAAGGGTLGTSGNNPRLMITGVTPSASTAYGFATVNGAAFAAYDTNGVVAIASTNTGQSSWTSAINAAPTSNQALTANRTVGTLLLNGGRTISGAYDLTVASGGILSTGTGADVISVDTLHAGSESDQLFAHVYGSGGLTISSSVTNDGATAKGFVKSGDGTLTLSGTSANTYTGVTTVNAGTLVLAKSDNTTAIAGDMVIGDGRGTDTVRLGANEQIANTASVTLRGGEVGNDANVARFELNGAVAITDASRVESFATLNVTGNSVLDFGGGTICSPTMLYLDVLNVASGALLTIENWIEFTDFLLVKKTSLDTSTEQEQLARVIFDGYGGSASWKEYDSNYYQIVPYSPVPEPGTYGIASLGALGAIFGLRRRKRTASAA